MNLLQRFEHWGDTHHPQWVDIVRIALGAFLVWRGIVFIENMGAELGRISNYISSGSFFLLSLGHLIVFAHLLGGVLIMLGVLTRFACLIQIPILIGAIIFAGTPGGLWTPATTIILALIVLGLLVYFLAAGNGRFSFDSYMNATSK
ncbi:DoxX family protein [Paraflavitalea sp. CAU 1676]|uniref:DoxX family protein n=1 Tax=Paraflavitalea sp. CAU 1676 TaxID=3032598 RepID=UPI0023DB7DD2|nr:DoxX family protein [Paraflavitalea sp. CAU 1676]MDF2188850.1 DoxX family protein [Paraflavitalea sp. CAU 1676]